MDTKARNTNQAAPQGATPVDQVTQDRLARLAARQSGQKPAATGRTNATTAPTGRTRKRHAAKASRTAALVLSAGTSLGLAAFFHLSDANANAASNPATTAATAGSSNATANTAANTANSFTGASTAATAQPSANTVTTAAPANASSLADGTYLGATSSNKWGPVQVQITVSSGQITDVTAVQTPWNRQRSVDINNQAAPILASEALTAQSAKIHTVSGATYTSKSYKVSLQSAIDQARAAATGVSA